LNVNEHWKPCPLTQRVDGTQCGLTLIHSHGLACPPAQAQETVNEFHTALTGNVKTTHMVLILGEIFDPIPDRSP